MPLAFIVTPNIPEAEKLSGMTITSVAEMQEAAEVIADLGPKGVLIKEVILRGQKWSIYSITREIFIFLSKSE